MAACAGRTPDAHLANVGRNPIEYLVKLLETDDFKQNTIDTAWLDGLIKEKSVQVDLPVHLTVVSAAVFKAFEHVKAF